MIQITPMTKVYLAVDIVDFRKGIDGLAALCRQQLKNDPFSGSLFVFRNRRGTALKILGYDGQGFWLCQKRFSQGKLCWWPTTKEAAIRLTAGELQVLLWNGNPTTAQMSEFWRKVG